MRRSTRTTTLVVMLAVVAGACRTGDDASVTEPPVIEPVEVVGGECTLAPDDVSMYRIWNEAALDAVRLDFPAPTVHARNLYHLSATLWDIWVAFDPSVGEPVYVERLALADDIEAARRDAMAFAAHHLLRQRYRLSLARPETALALDGTLSRVCGVDADAFLDSHPDSAGAFGVEVAENVLALTIDDGALERRGYEDASYQPVNPPLDVGESGAGDLVDPDRWQPLLLEVALSQNGIPLPGGEQTFVGPNWGSVDGFALAPVNSSTGPTRAPVDDPGPPPRIADPATEDLYRDQALEVLRASADLETGVDTIDISPGSIGDNSLGVDDGEGHDVNPATGDPYGPNVVDAADYYRIIAEYWADGPTSETPPGHWNSLANEVSDALDPVERSEWDVKLGLVLNGALHDAAITAWGLKAAYDSVRPITMIRWMGGNGPYDAVDNPLGLPLEPGLAEVVTEQSSAPGERHADLVDHVGEVAVRAWVGSPDDPETELAGVGWILAVDWLPYQRSTFVTPAFASYVSGHSTFSRAAAEVLAGFTGSDFFPGGLGSHVVPAGTLLHEEGPTGDVVLQWGTYFDAADEAGRSRIWGGIHIRADDAAGRRAGSQVGLAALARASEIFGGD